MALHECTIYSFTCVLKRSRKGASKQKKQANSNEPKTSHEFGISKYLNCQNGIKLNKKNHYLIRQQINADTRKGSFHAC